MQPRSRGSPEPLFFFQDTNRGLHRDGKEGVGGAWGIACPPSPVITSEHAKSQNSRPQNRHSPPPVLEQCFIFQVIIAS